MKSLIISILFFVTCILILLIGLWPFSFGIENGVRRLNKEAGIEFYKRGIAYANGQNKKTLFNSILKQIDAISIEIWLQPDKESSSNLSNFLCFYFDKVSAPIDMGQQNSALVIRIWKKSKTYFKTFDKIRLRDALPIGVKRFLTITSGIRGSTIYIDGKKSRYYPNRILLNNKKNFPLSCLVLGNDPTGKKPWNGKIFGLSIYDKELSQKAVFQNFQLWIQGNYSKLSRKKGLIAIYPMDETSGQWIYNRLANKVHLYIPDKFQVPKPLILEPPMPSSRLDYDDIIINILGFLPFGFLGMAFLSYIQKLTYSQIWLFLIVVLLGSLLSLAIELLQIYIPTRYSSSMDLICNILGTAAGAILFLLVIQKSFAFKKRRVGTHRVVK